MSLQTFGKGALRVAKNYTKGYSDVQSKVRDATSNDPWGPSGTQMNEIAQMTYNQQDFVEIMEMLDKRLNDKGKNWRHVWKSLTLLDYLLHAGSENVVLYFRDNLYVIKTLKEFQYIDEDEKDQGANVRQKAKDITNILLDESRLRDQRRSRAFMKDRMLNGERAGDEEDDNENVRRRSQSVPPRSNPRRKPQNDEDLNKALELSRRSLADEQARQGAMTAEERDLQEALRRSRDEEAARLKALEDSNSRALFDEGTQLGGPAPGQNQLIDISAYPTQNLPLQFTAQNPYYQQQQMAQQQAEYEWMLQQQQQQLALQQAQQQAAAQEEFMRQQQQQQYLMQQQQMAAQQQQQAQQMQMQSLFAQQPMQAQPTGFGSNNPFALAAGTANLAPGPSTSAPPSFNPQSSFQPQSQFGNFGSSSPGPQQQQPQSFASASPQPQRSPSPTTANTMANARRVATAPPGKHAELEAAFANRDDGQDTFGNIGALRFGQTQAGKMVAQKTGNNPFAKQQPQFEQPFFQI